MTDIGPGDFVECVDVAMRPWSDPLAIEALTLGAIYQVAQIVNIDGVETVELPDYWYLAERFRPIYKPKADIIELLKAQAPKQLEAA